MRVNGVKLEPDRSGALHWPEARLLAVADLHFEKGSGLAARGAGLIPPYDSRATLAALADTIDRLGPETVICLGDSFHDAEAEARLGAEETARLAALTGAVDWVWILGNHDPAPPAGLGGRAAETLTLGPLTFRHEPTADAQPGEVAGHLHPKAAIRRRGKRIVRRCFAADGQRVVLPAFGAYTGGLDVLDPAFAPVFPAGLHAWMLGREQVYRVADRRLVPIHG